MKKPEDSPGLTTEATPGSSPDASTGRPRDRSQKPVDIDRAVEGRDRLQGNEQTPMSPGVPDSGHT